MTTAADTEPADPYRWLEDVTADVALDWVRARNAETLGRLAQGDRFTALRTEILEALDSADRIPYVRRRGGYLYNFWQDAEHPRGLWRRTTLESYREPQPDWDVLLDVDALGAAESVNWVWAGAELVRPSLDRALVELSRGGSDAAVVREFDLESRTFVDDGFALPEAKSQLDWIDRDTVYVGTDFGAGSLTSSGYPRVAKRWRRGTSISTKPTPSSRARSPTSTRSRRTTRHRATSTTSSSGRPTSSPPSSSSSSRTARPSASTCRWTRAPTSIVNGC